MAILAHGLRRFVPRHHREGDQLGSLQHRELLDEYRANDSLRLYQFALVKPERIVGAVFVQQFGVLL